MTDASFLPTGIRDLDDILGGFQVGDNVVLQLQVGTPARAFTRAFLAEALQRGDATTYVSFDHSPATVLHSLDGLPPGDLTLLDCFTHGKGRSEDVFLEFYEREHPVRVVAVETPQFATEFHAAFDAVAPPGKRQFLLVESLTGMSELWGREDRVREFYTHSCPRLYDTRAIAVWLLQSRVHSEAFRAAVGNIAQVVVTLEREAEATRLRVERATGRTAPEVYRPAAYREGPDGVRIGGGADDAATRPARRRSG